MLKKCEPGCYVEKMWNRLFNNAKNYVPINPLTAEWALRAIIDFTLSNARWFYSSMGNPLDGKGLTTPKTMSPLTP